MSDALHNFDPTRRFDDRVADYVRYRPTYPATIIDAILTDLPPVSSLVAADIGAGTGISSRLLADRGVRVLAIEPNGAMRAGAAPHQLVRWLEGSAEHTGLDTRSVDLVVCAQAFHWFKKQEALAEFARVLRSAGRLAIMWNMGSPDDPAGSAYYDIVFNASDEARRIADKREYNDPFVNTPEWSPEPIVTADFVESYDLDGLLGRAMSASYVPKVGPESEHVRAQLRELFHQRQVGGLFAMQYRTTLFRARPK